jgi:hypothetical protein
VRWTSVLPSYSSSGVLYPPAAALFSHRSSSERSAAVRRAGFLRMKQMTLCTTLLIVGFATGSDSLPTPMKPTGKEFPPHAIMGSR